MAGGVTSSGRLNFMIMFMFMFMLSCRRKLVRVLVTRNGTVTPAGCPFYTADPAQLRIARRRQSLQQTMVNEGSGAIFGISEKIGCGLAMANKWSDPPVQIIMSFAFGVPALIAAMVMVAVYWSIFAVPLVWVAIYAYYQFVFLATPPADCEKYITFKARHPNLSH